MKKLVWLATLVLLFAVQIAWAQAPKAITMQGVAIDSKGVPLADGNREITFSIYESLTSDTPLWTEQQSVAIEEGRFSASLGSVNPINLQFDRPYYVGIKVGEGEELSPRMELQSSSFQISEKKQISPNGKKVKPLDIDGASVEGQAAPEPGPGLNDQVINDDLIVTGSICVGFDCVNGENFGFDTIRMKENNLRIRAVDTSNSGSFPTRDWQITFNDSSNGGQEKFSIEDIDAGRTPFTIEGSAPSNALYVDDGGRWGRKTSNPVVDIHDVSGNTPTLRLEQDGSSGFTPQTWDVAGNETNFFIRDVTNGSQLPFRIRPGADSNSLYIDSDNDVGIGTASPSAPFHVVETDNVSSANPVIHSEITNATVAARVVFQGSNKGSTSFVLKDTDGNHTWTNGTNGSGYQITKAGTGVAEFLISANGDISGAHGTYHTASDIRLKKDIETIPNALEKVLALRGVTYSWKDGSDGGTRQMGLIAQDVEKVAPEVVHTADDEMQTKAVEYAYMVGLLVEAIKGQQEIIEAQRASLDQQAIELSQTRTELSDLDYRLAQFESMLPRRANPELTGEDRPDYQYKDLLFQHEIDEDGRPVGSN